MSRARERQWQQQTGQASQLDWLGRVVMGWWVDVQMQRRGEEKRSSSALDEEIALQGRERPEKNSFLCPCPCLVEVVKWRGGKAGKEKVGEPKTPTKKVVREARAEPTLHPPSSKHPGQDTGYDRDLPQTNPCSHTQPANSLLTLLTLRSEDVKRRGEGRGEDRMTRTPIVNKTLHIPDIQVYSSFP